MTVSIRKDITFARLVYEHLDFPEDRSKTPWTPSRTELSSWIEHHHDWRDHRLVYIERCRLKGDRT